jgi:hypothetical protein
MFLGIYGGPGVAGLNSVNLFPTVIDLNIHKQNKKEFSV